MVRKNTGPSKNARVKLIQLHMYQGSPLFPIFRALSRSSAVIPLLPKAAFTPSIQPNLGLPRTRPPLTSAINTLLRVTYFQNYTKTEKLLNTVVNVLTREWDRLCVCVI